MTDRSCDDRPCNEPGGHSDVGGVRHLPEPSAGQLDRLLESAPTPQTSGSVVFPRLEALLAAAAAPDLGPQPGEREALDAFREHVAGTPSLAARRRRRLAVVALGSTVIALGSGVAAAATGTLPGAAQSTAKSVLGALGVQVPGPNAHAGTHPDQRGQSALDHGNPNEPTVPSVPEPTPPRPTHPAFPAAAATRPTPANSGPARHHGKPAPNAGGHPAPHHGKPTAPPVVSHGRGFDMRVARARVMHPTPTAITR